MKLLVNAMLAAHIIAGFTALLVGLIPMLSQKGSRLHNRAGLIYFWCMVVVSVSAVYLVFFKPSSLFLLFIAIMSFYQCFTGRRMLRLKRQTDRPEKLDTLAAYSALTAALAMVGLGVWNVIKLLNTGEFSLFGMLFFFFAGILGTMAWHDVTRSRQQATTDRMEWLYGHISRMVGSYIATLTAFATVNTRYIPHDGIWIDIAAWTLPGILGGMFIRRWILHYKQSNTRQAVAKKQDASPVAS